MSILFEKKKVCSFILTILSLSSVFGLRCHQCNSSITGSCGLKSFNVSLAVDEQCDPGSDICVKATSVVTIGKMAFRGCARVEACHIGIYQDCYECAENLCNSSRKVNFSVYGILYFILFFIMLA